MKYVSKIKNKKYDILSFMIPLLILVISLISIRVLFYGKYTFLIGDLQGQYYPLFSYLKNIFTSGESIFYSFSKGIGGNIFGSFAYYLLSPFNLIVLLFSFKNIYRAIILIILIKISLSGFTMYKYIDYKFSSDKKHLYLLFSTAYALSGYVVGYYFNIMWLDGVYMLPIVFMGIEKILEGKKPTMYIVSLFYTILSNFYIGYMICIGSVIYYLYQLIITEEYHKDKKKMLNGILTFGFVSLFTGLATMAILYPALSCIMSSSKGNVNIFSYALEYDNNFLFLARRLMIGYPKDDMSSVILNKYSPLIYCGIIIIPLLILYFLNKKIPKKERIASFIIIAFFVVSFQFNILNYIWHGFNYPICYNQRYSFILIFFMLIISLKSMLNIDSISKKKIIIIMSILPIISILILLFSNKYLKIEWLIVSNVLYLIYCLIIYMSSNIEYKNYSSKILITLCLLTCCELFLNLNVSLSDFSFNLVDENNASAKIIKNKIDKVKENDDTWYRMEQGNRFVSNNGLLYDYNGVTSFLSDTSSNLLNYFKNVGYTTTLNSVYYDPGINYYMDSILGIKYIMSDYNLDYKKIDSYNYSRFNGELYSEKIVHNYKVYKNEDTLSIGYMITDKHDKFVDVMVKSNYLNCFEYSNAMLKTMNDSNDNIYDKISLDYSKETEKQVLSKKIKKRTYEFSFTNKTTTDYYYYLFLDKNEGNAKESEIEVYVNDKLVNQFTFQDNKMFKIDNKFKENEKVKIKIVTKKCRLSFVPFVYKYNKDVVKKGIEELKENQLEITKITNTYLKGKITVPKDKNTLMLSIPYEEGWTLKVDGKVTKYKKLYDAFIGVELKEGKHTIELSFYPPGLNKGILISFISFLLGIIYYIKRKVINEFMIKIYLNYEEIFWYLVFGILTTFVSILTYWLFAKGFHIQYIISTVLSWILSVLFAFITNKLFVFKSKTNTKEELLKESYQFYKYRIISLGVELALMFILVSLMKFNDMVSKIIVQLIVIILNYVFSKLFVFNKIGINLKKKKKSTK